MEQLDRKDKNISVTFLVDEDMDKEVNELMKEKNWKRSAFIRVAIQKELDRISNYKEVNLHDS